MLVVLAACMLRVFRLQASVVNLLQKQGFAVLATSSATIRPARHRGSMASTQAQRRSRPLHVVSHRLLIHASFAAQCTALQPTTDTFSC